MKKIIFLILILSFFSCAESISASRNHHPAYRQTKSRNFVGLETKAQKKNRKKNLRASRAPKCGNYVVGWTGFYK